MIADNNWYGHRKVLMEYIGLKDRSVFAWLQHGWQSQFLKKFSKNIKKKFYPLLFWTKSNQIFYNRRIKGYTVGSPFLYLCKMLDKYNDNLKISTPKGTLVFPPHSSQDFPQRVNHSSLIKKVVNSSPGPYTACFYFYDFNKKKYPKLFNSFLSSKKGYELAKKELGHDCIRSKEELKKILGVNSPIKMLAAKIIAKLYDIKYGSELRLGKNMSKKK